MWTSTVLAAAVLALAAGVCPKYEKDYYEEVGCKPAVVGEDGCAKSYDCSMIRQRAQDKCYYQGKAYEAGYNLKVADDCLAGCRCAESFPDKKLAFSCVSVECPELFHGPPAPECYSTFEHDKCCSVDQVCLSGQTAEQKAARTTCQYKSEEYQIGMKFYPEEAPCLQCICQPGFNGSLVEPFCKKINCNLELHYGLRISEGCAPVYYGQNDCCPIGWRCPEKSDSVAPAASSKDGSKSSDSSLQCQFGDVKMQIGEKLSPSATWPEAECTCRVPPHPVCVQSN